MGWAVELLLLAKVPLTPGAVASAQVLQEETPHSIFHCRNCSHPRGFPTGRIRTGERGRETWRLLCNGTGDSLWSRKFLCHVFCWFPSWWLLEGNQINLWSQSNEQWRAACPGRALGSLCCGSCPGFQHREELWDQQWDLPWSLAWESSWPGHSQHVPVCKASADLPASQSALVQFQPLIHSQLQLTNQICLLYSSSKI